MISQIVCAQKNDIALQRKIIDEAISIVEDYESYATMSDDEIRYSFLDLFINDNVPVYNDLIGLTNKSSITAQEYSNLLSNGPRNKNAKFTNVKKDKIWKEENTWKVSFSLDKNISYSDKCGVFFSSSEFYGKDYHLTMTLIYDEKTERCKIEEIKGTIDSQQKFPDTYFVFKSEDKLDKYLFYNGKSIKLNSHNQSILPGKYDKKQFHFIDEDMKISPIVDDCENVSMKYRTRTSWLKAHYDMSLGDAFRFENNSNELKIDKKTINNIGLDFGYVFPSKSILKTGVFVGLGFSQSKIDLSYSNADYTFLTTVDVDDDSYIRHYQNLKVNQAIRFTDLTIPIYADFSLHFNRIVNVFVDLGIKFHLNMSHKVESSEGSAYIYGIYPQYNNLRMDEHWGYNGFGNATFGASDLNNSELLDVSGFTADAFGSIGLRFNIPETPLAVDLGVSYQIGLSNLIKANDTAVSLDKVADSSHALVYNTLNGLTNTEHLRNLTESFTSVKRQALMFNIGLIFKF